MRNLVLLIAYLSLSLTPAMAKEQADFALLYKSKNYTQICKNFEEDQANNWKHADLAYFYALALISSGRAAEGVQVCKTIVNQFPKSNESKMARSAIKLWTPAKTPNEEPSHSMTTETGIVGLKFEYSKGILPRVSQVFHGAPADQAGVQPNDVIAAVNGTSTLGLSMNQIFALLVGTPGTSLTITILRDNVQSEKRLKRMKLEEFKNFDSAAYQKYLMSI